jgi:hypothetical protein
VYSPVRICLAILRTSAWVTFFAMQYPSDTTSAIGWRQVFRGVLPLLRQWIRISRTFFLSIVRSRTLLPLSGFPASRVQTSTRDVTLHHPCSTAVERDSQ